MGSSGHYGPPHSNEDRLALLDQAYELGERFWDTADMYGDSEIVLGKWLAKNPEKRQSIFLATKFGIQAIPSPPGYAINSTPKYCRSAIDNSLQRLDLPFVDVYYVHRLDKVTPIEKTMEALVELKNAGKIKHIGLSECSPDSLRRAYAVHPITCVQVEYSLFCTEIELPARRLLEAARELNVGIVAYSPLGNGVLTGLVRTRADVSKTGDLRGHLPWLAEEHIEKNIALVDRIGDIARQRGVSMPQLALAWLLKQGDDIFPIPGSSRIERLKGNLESSFIEVSDHDEKTLRLLGQEIAGGRFQNGNWLFLWGYSDFARLDEE
ncbi:Aldo/keto reductase [Penicillium capsulatum]|uniref:Aldo/keto reductase n=1 Tax=Penicillium capsulatum TaxID=69766 RepID=A0A9W9LLM3_9EURO|nr:Aldo/keto reductase [Penicillium capsulatum]KAJ6116776.1 Aldo/keto reductase [Penicillium capsulatum]